MTSSPSFSRYHFVGGVISAEKGKAGSVLYGDRVSNVAGSRGEEPGRGNGGKGRLPGDVRARDPVATVKIAQLGKRQRAKVLPQA